MLARIPAVQVTFLACPSHGHAADSADARASFFNSQLPPFSVFQFPFDFLRFPEVLPLPLDSVLFGRSPRQLEPPFRDEVEDPSICSAAGLHVRLFLSEEASAPSVALDREDCYADYSDNLSGTSRSSCAVTRITGPAPHGPPHGLPVQ